MTLYRLGNEGRDVVLVPFSMKLLSREHKGNAMVLKDLMYTERYYTSPTKRTVFVKSQPLSTLGGVRPSVHDHR